MSLGEDLIINGGRTIECSISIGDMDIERFEDMFGFKQNMNLHDCRFEMVAKTYEKYASWGRMVRFD